MPSQPGAPGYEQGGFEQPVEEGALTEERVALYVRTMLTTLPETIKKPWLATPVEDQTAFVHELTIYCNNHDLDPSEYLGDWFPVVMCAVPIGAGILNRHRDHKKEGKDADYKKKKEFDSTTGSAEEHTPVEKKGTEYDQSSGTDLPEDESIELTEEIENEQPIDEHNGGFGTDDAEETADSEPSVGIL